VSGPPTITMASGLSISVPCSLSTSNGSSPRIAVDAVMILGRTLPILASLTASSKGLPSANRVELDEQAKDSNDIPAPRVVYGLSENTKRMLDHGVRAAGEFLSAAGATDIQDEEAWWPEYSWTKFFWFNSTYFVVMIASVILYDFRSGVWMILPLAWVIERACNGVWHVGWSIRFHEYSPGLVSSILMWMNLYFVVR
jgi:hypothetical protein